MGSAITVQPRAEHSVTAEASGALSKAAPVFYIPHYRQWATFAIFLQLHYVINLHVVNSTTLTLSYFYKTVLISVSHFPMLIQSLSFIHVVLGVVSVNSC